MNRSSLFNIKEVVPRERIELSLCFQNRILNPARLPVPPPRQRGLVIESGDYINGIANVNKPFKRISKTAIIAAL